MPTDQRKRQTTKLPKALTGEPKRSRAGRIEGRLRDALLAMTWDNLTDSEAAVKFKITVTAIRSAQKKPFVAQFLRAERQVLLGQERLKNPHRLARVADSSANGNAVVSAVRMIEELSEEQQASRSRQTSPGIVVIIGREGREQQQQPITHRMYPTVSPPPVIEHEPVHDVVEVVENEPDSAPHHDEEPEEPPLSIAEQTRRAAIPTEPGVRLAPAGLAGIRDLAQHQPKTSGLRGRGARRRVGPDD